MPQVFTDSEVQAWFERHTLGTAATDTDELIELKAARGARIGVCLPALNEAATIGAICECISSRLMKEIALVDELVVVDSGSKDGTHRIAREAGAIVYDSPVSGGKGEALWKSLAVLDTDVIVWLDSDTRNFGPHFVTGLVAPLLADPEIAMVKAFYRRPLVRDDIAEPSGGARVTELVVRPLVNLIYPRLAGVIQPLAGECAVRRDVFMKIPFFTGYAVEIGLLLDVVERLGLNALVQVDLGTRVHRNREVPALGQMAFQVIAAMLARMDEMGRIKLADELSDILVQFDPGSPRREELEVRELPPMSEVLEASR
ncbi:MAG: glucosyl-3-phosphoglycerate synthase [Actinomycetota bacterium]